MAITQLQLLKTLLLHEKYIIEKGNLMNKTLRKELKKYLQSVDSNLFCDKKSKRKILAYLKKDIHTQIETGTIKSITDIIDMFGTPENTLSFYDINEVDVEKLYNTKKSILKAIIISLAIIIFLFITYVLFEIISPSFTGDRYEKIDVTSVSSITAPPITD